MTADRPGAATARRAAALLALCLSATLALAACGDDEETDEAAAEPQQVTIEAPQSPEEPLTVPASLEPGAVEITLDNTSEGPAAAQLIRVEGEHSPDEVLKGLGAAMQGKPFPEWFFAGGGVGTTPPGQTRSVTQPLEPGTYYALNDEGREPVLSDPIEVTGEPVEAALPEAGGTVTTSEYTFEAEGLTGDSGEITFANEGEQPHHLVAAPLAEGATLDDVRQFFETEKGPPPIDFKREVSTAVLEGGDKQVTQVELEPGRYAFVCFIADREGGPPHIQEGMLVEAEVE